MSAVRKEIYDYDDSGRPSLKASASDWLDQSKEELESRHDFILEAAGNMDRVRSNLFVQAYRKEDWILLGQILQANATDYVKHCIQHKLSHRSASGCRDEFDAVGDLLNDFPDDATLARKATQP